MPYLRLEDIEKSFGSLRALDGIDLTMEKGEILAVLGPSGCGKTTLLRIIAGLERPDAGRVVIGDQDLQGVPPHHRGVGLMFQDYSLFPHLDVARNIAFGLRMKGWPPHRIAPRVKALLRLVRLENSSAQAVLTLSGGEQQRVALARSLAPSPSLLMLDEPLGALDTVLRSELVEEVPRILREARQTALYVTHDPEEALAVSDRVALFHGGRIEQIGAPGELLVSPASAFVARFLSLGVLIPAALHGERLETDIGSLPWNMGILPGSGEGFILVRPTAVSFTADGGLPRAKARFVRFQLHHDGVAWRIALKGKSGAEYGLNVLPWHENGKIDPPAPDNEMVVEIRPEGLAFFAS